MRSAFVDDLGPRRRLECEKPIGERPVSPDVRECVGRAIPRLVLKLRRFDLKRGEAKGQNHNPHVGRIALGNEPEPVGASAAREGVATGWREKLRRGRVP